MIFGLFYYWLLYQRIRFAQTQVHHRLKDVIAAIHRRIDEFDVVLEVVRQKMSDETSVLQEFKEAKQTLLQALSAHDVNQIATADAELDRAEYDMKERLKAHEELRDNPEINRHLSDVNTVDGLFAQQVKAYNDTIDDFNHQIRQFPMFLVAQAMRVRRADRFMLEQATVMDKQLDAIVLD